MVYPKCIGSYKLLKTKDSSILFMDIFSIISDFTIVNVKRVGKCRVANDWFISFTRAGKSSTIHDFRSHVGIWTITKDVLLAYTIILCIS